MRVIFTMDIKKVKNKMTNSMIEITKELSKDKNFRKSVATNSEKICNELEKYYTKSGIVCTIDYYFEDGK